MRTVILIGDSIRMGYEAAVREQLAGAAEVWVPEQNGGTSENVLAHLDEWAIARRADLVHVNCGLHDLKRAFDAVANAVPLPRYEANVRAILRRIRDEAGSRILWALTTPVNQEWHHRTKPFDRFEADVEAYNAAARRAAEDMGVGVNDLFSVVTNAGRDALLMPDGVHFTPDGCLLLGRAVAAAIRAALNLRAG